ncbi:nitroreductase family protein [Salinivibrio kushneri]|uniref:nitroreductase family protein n=1 Tax=Salinivibrio kushneri TaxID=1908198 RepID=UPI0009873C21|nr:nitroreductase family protein [Salinivibrio kushneri]OOE62357.1 hypothetical protein BZG18_05290 [Salinivibrio kushneri]
MKNKIKKLIESFFSKTPKLASIYYAVFSKAMSYEAYTTLNGKKKFHSENTGAISVLRRNIHRLEKGMIMIPRRDVFALDYIESTVDAYIFCKKKAKDTDTIQWASDVLNEYFNIVSKDDFLERQYAKFKESSIGVSCEGNHPFLRGKVNTPVNYNELYKLSEIRRSVRWYQNKKVPHEAIDKAIELAKLSPSACNRQPYKMKIFSNANDVKEIASLPAGTTGFNHNFPMIIAFVGQLRNYYSEADRHIIYIDTSLFAMSFVLALESLGLSSCIINWPEDVVAERKANEKLKLDKDERIIFFMSVGYADEDKLIPYSGKKSIEELREYH